jgi:hypothetical protein
MFVAPEFVFVHLSKTGGTFVEETLREVLCPSALGRKLHRLKARHGIRIPFWKYRYDEVRDQHGLCNDIPQHERKKTILSCIRNPFDLYVSEYTFNWWKKYPHLWFHDIAAVEKAYPDWRNFTFEDFISVSNRRAAWVHRALAKFPKAQALGWYSHKFIHYYCRDPDYVFEVADDVDLVLQRVQESIHPVHFLHMERLNQELFEFLLSKSYPRQRIEFISQKGKINSSRKNQDYREWYSDRLRREVEQKDALIFRLFPEFQFRKYSCQPPDQSLRDQPEALEESNLC